MFLSSVNNRTLWPCIDCITICIPFIKIYICVKARQMVVPIAITGLPVFSDYVKKHQSVGLSIQSPESPCAWLSWLLNKTLELLIMGFCKYHPLVETSYCCAKYKQYLCTECLQCTDPKIYCKFRSACLIHFLDKEKKQKKMKNGDEFHDDHWNTFCREKIN